MNLNHSLARALMLLAVIAVVQMMLQMPSLGSPVATRFNSGGAAVSWSTPQEFVILNLMVVAAVLVISLFLPSLMGKRPRIRWNLPNREYWLAPERIEKTVEYVKRMMLWIGVMTLLLLMAVFQLVVDANTHIPPRLDSTRLYVIVGAFIVFMLLWAWAFWRKFARLPAASGDNPFG